MALLRYETKSGHSSEYCSSHWTSYAAASSTLIPCVTLRARYIAAPDRFKKCSSIAVRNPSLEPKWCLINPMDTSASAAIERTVTPSKPSCAIWRMPAIRRRALPSPPGISFTEGPLSSFIGASVSTPSGASFFSFIWTTRIAVLITVAM